MEKLRGLDKEAMFRLHQSGFLHGAYLVAASVGNVRKLIAMKQGKLRNQVQGTSAEDSAAPIRGNAYTGGPVR